MTYVSEIKIFSFNFAPRAWALCNGQTLPINQNQVLFSLLGTTYGGNGVTTFMLPNLQGRVPISMGRDPFGNTYSEGQAAGQASHTLLATEIPAHTHTMQASAVAATQNSPTTNSPAEPVAAVGNIYGPASPAVTMAPQAVANAGGSQPHDNMQPYLVLNMCISLQGTFPTRG